MAQRICIIGAGPAGLAALKAILDAPQFKSGLWQPIAFEARDKVGGIWVPAAPVDDPPLTPLYDSLTTNLPHPVMAYSSFSFPPSTYLFPRAWVVEEYLDAYADHFSLKSYIRLKTMVLSVARGKSTWKVSISSEPEPLDFDLVIVCNGHYSKPRYPDTPGLQAWLEAGRASHSAWYRSPEMYKGQTLLVVGAGPSGQDISAEVQIASSRVIHSITGAPSSTNGKLTTRPRTKRFGIDGQVEFEDGSVENDVEHCILATGYEMSFPFLPNSLLRPSYPPQQGGDGNLPEELYNSTYNVYPLARHLFPLTQTQYPPQTLAFMGLPIRVAPLPLLEAQAHAIIRFFSEPKSLNVVSERTAIVDRWTRLTNEIGRSTPEIWKAWHKFTDMEQFDYRDELYRFASSATNPSTPCILSQDWEKEAYIHKISLRKLWVELEKSGKADDFVRGVGKNGTQEWVDLMRKMLKMVEDRGMEDIAPGPAT